MPAIHPARLKLQAARLADHFTQPGLFVRRLKELLELYADRTHYPGRAGEPPPMLASYNTPSPVLRYLWQELRPLVETNPEAALSLSDMLWSEPYLELRQLATQLLRELSIPNRSDVMQRIVAWARPGLEERLHDALLNQALSNIRKEAPELIFDLIESWVTGGPPVQQLGLRAILACIDDPVFVNLPPMFNLISPFLRKIPPSLDADVLTLLFALIRRSPQEAAYLLRQNLSASDNPDTPFLTRQVLDEFPPEQQISLRQALKDWRAGGGGA